MNSSEKYRHELKYEISLAEYAAIKPILSRIMKPDSHADENGSYKISSLYFDNCYDTALRKKQDGVSIREKFRIRCYNDDLSFILLEKKEKWNGLCKKSSCVISSEQYSAIMSNSLKGLPPGSDELLCELSRACSSQLLRPKTIVVYNREPFVFAPGNVRITFDSDIRTGLYHTDLTQNDYPFIRVTPPGKMILEVKYDEFLPEIVKTAVQCSIPRLQAFSKYAACRSYE